MSEMLSVFRAILPALAHAAHKGEAGRIGVIGGSLEYTGAPYFAAISAMKAGADLAHVFCPGAAAGVIKAYSPELIVHPLLSEDPGSARAIEVWLPRLHALVVGPGLGREPRVLQTVAAVVTAARGRGMELVVDADGLHLVTLQPELVAGYPQAILTPNEVEFHRLYERMFKCSPEGSDVGEQTRRLAERLGGVVILRKGHVDTISNGSQVLQCCEPGSPRRCGGQGDLLSGTIGLFCYWARLNEETVAASQSGTGAPPPMVACWGGSFLVKKCAELAFERHQRSMLAGDLLAEIPTVFRTIFEPGRKP